MHTLKNFKQFLKELFAFAKASKSWWIIPVVLFLLLATLLIVGVCTVSPFVYSLF